MATRHKIFPIIGELMVHLACTNETLIGN